jgi:hypothetical protein
MFKRQVLSIFFNSIDPTLLPLHLFVIWFNNWPMVADLCGTQCEK